MINGLYNVFSLKIIKNHHPSTPQTTATTPAAHSSYNSFNNPKYCRQPIGSGQHLYLIPHQTPLMQPTCTPGPQ